MSDDAICVRVDVPDQASAQALERIVKATPGFDLAGGRPPAPGDVLILEVGEPGAEQTFLEASAALETGQEVFLISTDSSPSLLLAAMRHGIKEFLADPPREEEVQAALARVLERRNRQVRQQSARKGLIIDVIGSKGGIGTTTLAVNLAASLVQAGVGQVALLDMNLPYGEVPLFLDMDAKYHWGEVLRDIERLDQTFLSSVLARKSGELCVLAAPSQLDDLQAATPEAMARLLEMLRSMFDAVIIDGGQYLDEVAIKVMEVSDVVLLLAVQNLPCLTNVRRFLQHYRQLETLPEDKLKLVVNRHLKECELSVQDFEKAVGLKGFWMVPNDYQATLSAINHGKTLIECAGKAPVTKSIMDLAMALAPERSRSAKRGLFGLPLFGRRKAA